MTSEAGIDALLAQASQMARVGQVREAIVAYQKALELRPASPNSWYNLARLLRRVRRFDEALLAYQQALNHRADQPEEVHLNRAVILADYLARPVDAERELRTALALNPRYVPALLNLGNICEHRSDRSGAIAHYSRALFLDPFNALALARLTSIQPLSRADDPLILRLKQAIARPGAQAAERADLGFSLGAALDKIAAYDDAFVAYQAANVASRESAPSPGVNYDRQAHEQLIDNLIHAFPQVTPAGRTAEAAPRVVFVCGMFRSGSTLVEQILASHSQVIAGGELDLLPTLVRQHLPTMVSAGAPADPALVTRMRERYLATVRGFHPDAAVVTDRRHDNFLYIGLIKAMFPHTRIVHTRRHPIDNCLAIYFLHMSHAMPYALDLSDVAHWYGQYHRLMQHWKSLYGPDIIEVDYDTLVKEPEPQIRGLVEGLGLPWEAACLDFQHNDAMVKTAGVWQAPQALYTRSSGRWRHYARHLDPLVTELHDHLGEKPS